VDVFRFLEDNQKSNKLRMVRCSRLYDPNAEFVGNELDIVVSQVNELYRGPVTMNIVRSVIDTLTSMVAKNRPRPVMMTDGADYGLQLQAKDLGRFLEAHFERNDVYGDAVRMFKDATTVGLGAVKISTQDKKPHVERVLWDNLVIDELECRCGPPRQMHEVRYVDRDTLLEQYEDDAELYQRILIAAPEDKIHRLSSYRQVESEVIPVYCSWHLPSYPGAGDGVYCETIEGAVLHWEKWEYDEFPFVFYRWNERVNGFWGCGVAEELAGIQNKINKINWIITQRHDLSNSYLLVEAIDAAMKLRPMAGPGEPVQLLPYRGKNKPEFVVPPLVQPELYQHLIYLIQQAYAIAGVSEMSAASQKPAGIESAIAMQTYSDLETQRFSIQSQHFERSILQIARWVLRMMKRLADTTEQDMTEIWRSGKIVRKIDFRKVSMDETMYMMSIEAASITSRTPAGRLQAAMELGNAGILEREQILRLIDHPDLSRTLSLENAAIDHAEYLCEMLARGEYRQPNVLDQLPICIKYVSKAYLLALDTPNCPEEILDGYREWLRNATLEMSRQPPMAPPAPAPAPAGGAGPGEMNPQNMGMMQ
jgi:hypothetical protein